VCCRPPRGQRRYRGALGVLVLGDGVAVFFDAHFLEHRVVHELLPDYLDEFLAGHRQQFDDLEEGGVEGEGRRLCQTDLSFIPHGLSPPELRSREARWSS
jgi:hypothetical protein